MMKLLYVSFTTTAMAWITGPSLDSCEDMKPEYNSTIETEQTTPLSDRFEFEYQIGRLPLRKTELLDIPSNSSLAITVRGLDKNTTFEGLFMQFRPTNGSYILQGEWTKVSKAAFQALNCDGVYHSALGHRNNRLKLSATAIWRAPVNLRTTQRVSLYVTLVQDRNTTWTFKEVQKFLITPLPKTTLAPTTESPKIIEQTSMYYVYDTTVADQSFYYYEDTSSVPSTEKSLQELLDDEGSGLEPTRSTFTTAKNDISTPGSGTWSLNIFPAFLVLLLIF